MEEEDGGRTIAEGKRKLKDGRRRRKMEGGDGERKKEDRKRLKVDG